MALTLTYQQTEQSLRRFCSEPFSISDIPYIILEAFGIYAPLRTPHHTPNNKHSSDFS